MKTSLPVLNLDSATFECIFGRGCEGICCQKGQPPVLEQDIANIEAALPRVLPLMREAARQKVEQLGYLSSWRKAGMRTLRVAEGWCVFFNQGCLFHKIGAEEGDSFRYKPLYCAVFPLEQNDEDQWYVRQWGVEKEKWDLFCLNPKQSSRLAAETLADELRRVEMYETRREASELSEAKKLPE
jgi:Protein of unknown function (DUF3109)